MLTLWRSSSQEIRKKHRVPSYLSDLVNHANNMGGYLLPVTITQGNTKRDDPASCKAPIFPAGNWKLITLHCCYPYNSSVKSSKYKQLSFTFKECLNTDSTNGCLKNTICCLIMCVSVHRLIKRAANLEKKTTNRLSLISSVFSYFAS